jgi:hypothetical protein
MNQLIGIGTALSLIGILIAICSYFYARNKSKPNVTCFIYPHSEKSAHVKITIRNKSNDHFTVIEVISLIGCKKLYLSEITEIARNETTLKFPAHKTYSLKPSLLVEPDKEVEFEFLILSDDSIIDKILYIKLRTDSTLFQMPTKNIIIKRKYTV